MKTPDKIFVSTDPFGFMYAHDIKNYPSCAEEYIRKDALLDWLGEQLTASYNSMDIRSNLAYSRVVDKIKSL